MVFVALSSWSAAFVSAVFEWICPFFSCVPTDFTAERHVTRDPQRLFAHAVRCAAALSVVVVLLLLLLLLEPHPAAPSSTATRTAIASLTG
jgi:hypothetical protein